MHQLFRDYYCGSYITVKVLCDRCEWPGAHRARTVFMHCVPANVLASYFPWLTDLGFGLEKELMCWGWKVLGNILLMWTLPPSAGSLTESYDELGNRYQLPAYTLAPPVNLISETSSPSKTSDSTHKQAQPPPCRQEFQLRVRLSTGKKDPP